MKKMLSLSLCLMSLTLSWHAEAQILKKIGKKIEQSVERRVEKKIDKGIEDGLDKAEDGTESAVEGVFSSDQPQIQSLPENYEIKVSGSGPDVYLEYRIRHDRAEEGAPQANMSIKLYASPASGKGRAETTMEIPMAGAMRMSMLTDTNTPNRIIMLNERKRQYTVMDFAESDLAEPADNVYQVKNLGTENVRGLSCIHAQAINQDGDKFEIWTTREIPGYQEMISLYGKAQHMGSDNLWQAMQEADCAGFIVKFKIATEGMGTTMELVEVEKTTVPASMYTVPEGYEEKDGSWINSFMP